MRDLPLITYFSSIATIIFNPIDQKNRFFDVFQADYFNKYQYCDN